MIPYLIEAELVVTESLCVITGNALAHEYRDASHAESQVVEKMMSVLHDELQRPLLDGGWKYTPEGMIPPTKKKIPAEGTTAMDSSAAGKLIRALPYRWIGMGNPGSMRLRQVDKKLSRGGAPFVNIVVNIKAPRQTSSSILQKIDWRRIEGALKS